MKIGILPYDGFKSGPSLCTKVYEDLKQPLLNEIVAYIKINDGVHDENYGGPKIIETIREHISDAKLDIGIFLDMKVFDVDATLKNYANKYQKQRPDILTVSSQCSVSGIIALRKTLPDTKLALVSVLTDISEDECQRRFGASAKIKILNDLENLRSEYHKKAKEDNLTDLSEEPFDLIVCSVKEVAFLKSNLPDSYGFIVPGIRDSWMLADHQQRKGGVKEAVDLGATFLVMGAQLTKGNPSANPPISAEESQERTLAEIMKTNRYLFANPLRVLKHYDGYYSAKNNLGEITGSLVAYAGTYENEGKEKKNYIGFEYFNFAKAEENPIALDYFAKSLAEKLQPLNPDMIIGSAMGGVLLAGLTAKYLDCKVGFTEKKVIEVADPQNGKKEISNLIIDRHDINTGDKIIIIEDVVNNYSTTEKIISLIEKKGGQVIGIACAINRSGKVDFNGLTVKSVCEVDAKQFRQDDPEVLNKPIVFKPKQQWAELKATMKI